MSTPTNPAMAQLFADLHNHSILTAAGLDSEQASSIVFGKLKQPDLRSHVSDCCAGTIHFDYLSPYCTCCGEFCKAIPNV